MTDTIGSECSKEECEGTEYVCACIECEKLLNSVLYYKQEKEIQ